MIAIDTNVLVRLLVDDKQSAHQVALVKKLVEKQNVIYASQVVQVELVWVLESAYKLPKPDLINVLDALLKYSIILLENPNQFAQALELYKTATADFSDYIIFSNAKIKGYTFWTFDKRLAKTDGVRRLTENVFQNA